jgi:alkyl sulfatase BDS1-like metallo-beta-lactamase superfamily hydrolase
VVSHEPVFAFDDQQDFEDADRGFIAALDPGVIRNAAGEVVWDNDSYRFLSGDVADTVHPSLWRQSSLVAKQGLFEVTDGIFRCAGSTCRTSPLWRPTPA